MNAHLPHKKLHAENAFRMREFRASRLFFLRGFRVSRLFFVVACIARSALADIEVEAEYNIETPQQLQVATNTQQLQTGIASNMASVYSAYNGQSDTPASAMVNGEIIVQAPPVPAPPAAALASASASISVQRRRRRQRRRRPGRGPGDWRRGPDCNRGLRLDADLARQAPREAERGHPRQGLPAPGPPWVHPARPATWQLPATTAVPAWLLPGTAAVPAWILHATAAVPAWLLPATAAVPAWLLHATAAVPAWILPATAAVPAQLRPVLSSTSTAAAPQPRGGHVCDPAAPVRPREVQGPALHALRQAVQGQPGGGQINGLFLWVWL
jgi:hypothetical protein